MYRKNGLCVPKGRRGLRTDTEPLIVGKHRTRESLHQGKPMTSVEYPAPSLRLKPLPSIRPAIRDFPPHSLRIA
jgi:hypothetical protein